MIIPIPIPIGEQFILVPENTRREEIQKLLEKRRMMSVTIVSVALVGLGVVLWLVLNPNLKELYASFNQQVPMRVQIAPLISIVLGAFTYLALQKILVRNVDFVSVKTNEGKLKVTLVSNVKLDLLVCFILGIAVAVLVLIYVIPIYSLTASF